MALLVAGLSVFVLTIRYGGAFFHCVQPFFHVYECFCLVVSLSGFAVRVYTVAIHRRAHLGATSRLRWLTA